MQVILNIGNGGRERLRRMVKNKNNVTEQLIDLKIDIFEIGTYLLFLFLGCIIGVMWFAVNLLRYIG